MTFVFQTTTDRPLAIALKGRTCFFRNGIFTTDNNQLAGQLRLSSYFGKRFIETTPKEPSKPAKEKK